MNVKTIYDAVSGVEEKYIVQADNINDVRLSFRKNRIRNIKTIGTVCVCATVVIATGLLSAHGRLLKKTSETSKAFVPQENTLYTDSNVTSQTQNRQTAAGEKSALPSEETENHNPKTENHSASALTGNLNRQKTKAPVNENPSADESVIWGDEAGSSNSSIISWNGKQVSYMLWEALKRESSDKKIAIIASPRIDRQYVFNGKTIAQYEANVEKHKDLTDKLQQLLKEGEMLKYGKALYTTGASNGEKWDMDFYNSRIRYYGTELLSEYIVNGDFLADQVAADLSNAKEDTTAKDEYNKAVSAFYSQTVNSAKSVFSSAGMSCSVMDNGKALLFFASADRFAGLKAPENAEWFFTLAQRNSGETVTPE